jgi:hypothetical protein
VPLSAKRQFQLFCSEHFPGLADILDCLAADQLWALLSMRVQLAVCDQPHAQSAAVRFGGLGRRFVLMVAPKLFTIWVACAPKLGTLGFLAPAYE